MVQEGKFFATQRKSVNALKIRIGPYGAHYFDRASGLNLLADEISFPARKWTTSPRNISIALTNACDLKCGHCYAPKHKAILDRLDVERWAAELDAVDSFGVGFGGGEPTLWPHLAKVCDYLTAQTELAVSMTTHGHFADKKLPEKLAGNIHFVRVSMDGVGETYESVRGMSFSALLDNLRAVRDISMFGINYVVNRSTFPDIDAAVELAEASGASEFLLLPEQPVGRSAGIDAQTFSELTIWAKEYQGSLMLSVNESSADGFEGCDPVGDIHSLTGYAHIDASGFIKRRSYDHVGVKVDSAGVLAALSKLRKLGSNE